MDLIEAYLKELKLFRSPKTVKNYRSHLTNFQRHLGKPLDHVSRDDIINYIDYLLNEKRLQKSSVNTFQTCLNTFYQHLLDTGQINESPYKKINWIKVEKKAPIYLTIDELKRLLEVAEIRSIRDKLVVLTLYTTGVRVSELVNIQKKDISFDKLEVKIFGKGSKERFVAINEWLAKELEDYTLGFKDDQKIFEVTTHTIERDIRILAKMAQINKKVTPHKLRHSFATHMLQNGGNIVAIQKLLGHKNLYHTSDYLHYNIDDLKSIHNAALPDIRK